MDFPTAFLPQLEYSSPLYFAHSLSPAPQSPPFDLDFSASSSSDSDTSGPVSPATSYLATPGGSPVLVPLDYAQGQHKGHTHAQADAFAAVQQDQHKVPAFEAYQIPIAQQAQREHNVPQQHTQYLYSVPGPLAGIPVQQDPSAYPPAAQHLLPAPQSSTAFVQPTQPQVLYQPQATPFGYAQQPQQAYYYVPQPAPVPSFETPQGTYYFVPNTNNGPQIPSLPPQVQMPWTQTGTEDLMALVIAGASGAAGESKPKLPGSKQGKKSTRKNAGKGQVKRFICPHPDCGRAFARNFNMQSHLKSHLGIRDFDCPHCPKKFSRRHDRARHCAAVHDSHHVDDLTPSRSGSHDADDDEEEDEDTEG